MKPIQRLLAPLLLLGMMALSACQPALPTGTATVLPPDRAEETAAVSPTVEPTAVPQGGWLPAGTIAVYMAGPFEDLELYALLADGTPVPLGREVHYRATVSRSGRWLATPDARPPAQGVIVTAPGRGITHTLSVPDGYEVYDMAFDAAETRLAFLALAAPGSGLKPWALVVVHLEDGMATRFEGEREEAGGLLPGAPIGWRRDNEVLIDTFIPFTSGPFMGLWALTLPQDAAAGAGELGARLILPSQSYRSRPLLAPQAPRLLYLGRDESYRPRGYEPVEYDLAANQLWSLDLAAEEASLLAEVRDGSALARAVAWSPDGQRALYVQGMYAANELRSLSLKTVDLQGAIVDVGPLILGQGGALEDLAWCQAEAALAAVRGPAGQQLYQVDLNSGEMGSLAAAETLEVLRCVAPEQK